MKKKETSLVKRDSSSVTVVKPQSKAIAKAKPKKKAVAKKKAPATKKAKNIKWKEKKTVMVYRFYQNGVLVKEMKDILPKNSDYAIQESLEIDRMAEVMRLKASSEPKKYGYVVRCVEGKDSVPFEWIGLAPEQAFRSELRNGKLDSDAYRQFPMANIYDPSKDTTERDILEVHLDMNVPAQAEVRYLPTGHRMFLLPPHITEAEKQKLNPKKKPSRKRKKNKDQLNFFDA